MHQGNDVSLPGEQGLEGKIQDIAKAQRMLLVSILVNLLGNALLRADFVTGLILIPIALGTMAFSMWCVYRLCKALSVGPVLWIIAMFIPLINLICLVILNQKATTFLKAQGLKVGLMGAEV
jgi:hypothetical protein